MTYPGERGTVTVFVVGLTLALLVTGGLVYDGGHLLAARREAANVAEAAARTGAQELDTGSLRGSGVGRLDPEAARARAEHWLATSGYRGSVSVEGDVVVVEIEITRRLFLLGLGGLARASVTAEGRARAARGVLQEGD